MRADIMHQDITPPTDDPTDADGHWETQQDPDTGEIVRVWVPATEPTDPADPSAPSVSVPCRVRGHVTMGAPTSDVSEGFSGKEYIVGEFAKMWLPTSVAISRRDQVTNIRDRKGRVAFREDEFDPATATVYSVVGVTPIIDPLAGHIENFVMLERAQVQVSG